MNKINRIGVSFALILTVLLGMVNVCQAKPSTSGFSVWDMKTTNDLDKSWTIKFNDLLATDTVNNNNIYIIDSNNHPVAVTLNVSSDNTAVSIKPVNSYTAGNEYWLYVTSGVCCQSAGGQIDPLSKPLVMPFVVARDGYIQLMSNVYNPLLTDLSVITTPAVHSVSINGTNMLYQGKNKFRLGVAGLALEAKVIVKAYDGSGKLLQTLDHIVD